MKNRLSDLADHLFVQLERLNDEELNDDQLRREIARAGAMSQVARTLVDCGELALSARRVQHDLPAAGSAINLLGLDGK